MSLSSPQATRYEEAASTYLESVTMARDVLRGATLPADTVSAMFAEVASVASQSSEEGASFVAQAASDGEVGGLAELSSAQVAAALQSSMAAPEDLNAVTDAASSGYEFAAALWSDFADAIEAGEGQQEPEPTTAVVVRKKPTRDPLSFPWWAWVILALGMAGGYTTYRSRRDEE